MANYPNYGNDSSAYKFELFEDRKQRTEPRIKVIRDRRLEKAYNRNNAIKTLAFVSVFFVGVISILLNQIAITELTNQVSKKTAELENLENEYRILSTELESSMALSNIQTVITRDMGMTKLNDSQVTYVNLSEGDTMTLPEGSESNIFAKVWNAVKDGAYTAAE